MTPTDSLHLDEHLARLLAAYDQGIGDGNERATREVLAAEAAPIIEAGERLVEPLSGGAVNEGSITELLPDSPGPDPFIITANAALPETHRIGRFELRRQLGKGGCGIVFLAFDPKLKREVALKIPRPELLMSTDARRRLLREATAAAGFDHPNLVPVYETGEIGPVCFIATVFCPGQTLSDWLDRQSYPVPIRQTARLVAQLAEAVQHAHDRSVLHRDLKPNNVILQEVKSDPNAQDVPPGACPLRGDHFIPRIVDFGLAKLTDQGPSETATRQILGTPKYMAPEQAQARHEDVGPEADVYALGVILYEMLAGRTPYEGATDVEVLRLSIEGNLTAPRSLRREIPRDLEAICLKAMARTPARRYRSAIDMADDLRRFLDDLPTLARPLNGFGRAARWLRRNDQAFALAVLSTISCMLLGIGMVNAYQADRYRDVEGESRVRDAERIRLDAQRNYARHVRDAFFAWRAGDPQQSADSLRDARLQSGLIMENPDFAWNYLAGLGRSERSSSAGMADKLPGTASAIAVRPDGSEYAIAYADGAVEVIAKRGATRRRIPAEGRNALALLRLPESGPLIGVELSPEFVTLWDFGASPKLLFRKEIVGTAADFNLASGLLAVGDTRGRITIYSMADVELQISIETGRADPVRHLAFADHGRLIAAPTADHAIGIWSVDDPNARFKIPGHGEGTALLRFIGNDRIATAGSGSSIKTWNLASGRIEHTMLGHIRKITGLAISPDLRTLVSGSESGDVKLWDLRTGQELIGLRRHDGPMSLAEFSGDGHLLITGGIDVNSHGEIAFWDAPAE